MQINRLFEIIYILLHKKKVSATELAEQLGVSRRTICRDIDTLSIAGIPVYAEKGRGGGISLLPDFVLDKAVLTEQEQNEILTALHGLAPVKTGETADVLNKLSTIFNKTVTNWLEVDFSDWNHSDDFSNFKTAILESLIIEFDYYNSYGEKTFRRVEPKQLLFKYKSWYLKAFCLTKQGARLYKLTRINNLVVTDEKFPVRDLSFSEPDNNSQATHKERKDITIKLRIAPEMTYRVFDDFDVSLIEKQSDGSFIVTRTYPEDNWVYSYVLSFGEHVQVLEPVYLKEIIAAKIKKMSENYF